MQSAYGGAQSITRIGDATPAAALQLKPRQKSQSHASGAASFSTDGGSNTSTTYTAGAVVPPVVVGVDFLRQLSQRAGSGADNSPSPPPQHRTAIAAPQALQHLHSGGSSIEYRDSVNGSAQFTAGSAEDNFYYSGVTAEESHGESQPDSAHGVYDYDDVNYIAVSGPASTHARYPSSGSSDVLGGSGSVRSGDDAAFRSFETFSVLDANREARGRGGELQRQQNELSFHSSDGQPEYADQAQSMYSAASARGRDFEAFAATLGDSSSASFPPEYSYHDRGDAEGHQHQQPQLHTRDQVRKRVERKPAGAKALMKNLSAGAAISFTSTTSRFGAGANAAKADTSGGGGSGTTTGSGGAPHIPGRRPRRSHVGYTPHTLKEYREHMAATVGVFLPAPTAAAGGGGASAARASAAASHAAAGDGASNGAPFFASSQTYSEPQQQQQNQRQSLAATTPQPTPAEVAMLSSTGQLQQLLQKRQARDRATAYGDGVVRSFKQHAARTTTSPAQKLANGSANAGSANGSSSSSSSSNSGNNAVRINGGASVASARDIATPRSARGGADILHSAQADAHVDASFSSAHLHINEHAHDRQTHVYAPPSDDDDSSYYARANASRSPPVSVRSHVMSQQQFQPQHSQFGGALAGPALNTSSTLSLLMGHSSDPANASFVARFHSTVPAGLPATTTHVIHSHATALAADAASNSAALSLAAARRARRPLMDQPTGRGQFPSQRAAAAEPSGPLPLAVAAALDGADFDALQLRHARMKAQVALNMNA